MNIEVMQAGRTRGKVCAQHSSMQNAGKEALSSLQVGGSFNGGKSSAVLLPFDWMLPLKGTINYFGNYLSSPVLRPLGNEVTGIYLHSCRNVNSTIFSSLTLFNRQFGHFPRGPCSMFLGLVSYCGPLSARFSPGTLPRTRPPSR